jgi:hypothetical protein
MGARYRASTLTPVTNALKVLFIAGAGRSGTSTLAGLVSRLGLHVPQPEVAADETNPKGFGEPQWVVDFHNRVLNEIMVQVSDSRPEAWSVAAAKGAEEETLSEVTTWLGPHFDECAELVVKDPRLSWFLPLWHDAAERCDSTAVVATMLRPPPEVVGSKQKYYENKLGSAHLTASWLNMLLHTELATRDTPRSFVRYADLLDDYRATTASMGERLELAHVTGATAADWARLDGFIDPSLRRVGLSWADLELPTRLEELTRTGWEALNTLADGETPEALATLDQVRASYSELYAESEAISKSSAVAERVAGRREVRAARPAPTPRPTSRLDAIPHGWRAAIPAPVRRGLRKVLPRR